MAGLKKDNLSDSLLEYLEGLGLSEEQVQQLIDNISGDLSALQTTDKSSLVAAINELFQSANNGKELIATAIGEPLNSSDTFSAMSTGINGLLSSFKTNMMNNGVTVESNDKFKSLIDKIKGLTEGEGNRGVQFAEGVYDGFYVQMAGAGQDKYVTTDVPIYNLGFTPTYVFLNISEIVYTDLNTNVTRTITNNIVITNLYHTDNAISVPVGGYDSVSFKITNVTDTYCSISVSRHQYQMKIENFNNIKWYAIGVGEEDTTLRDSLASILQDEGVSVTEEDDMASLIAKVDSEFDRQVVPAGDAVAANVLSGKTFINNTGSTITGTMANMPTHTQVTDYVAWNEDSIYLGIPTGAYVNTSATGYPEVYIEKTRLDSNLVPENIVSGKSICGVNGTASKGYKFVSGTEGTLYSGNVYSGSPSASAVIDVKGYTFWFNGVVKVTTYITDNGGKAEGASIGKYTIELYDSSGTLKSTDTYPGYKDTKTVKDYTVSNGDYFRYKPDNSANYGSGIFKMNVLIQTSVTSD